MKRLALKVAALGVTAMLTGITAPTVASAAVPSATTNAFGYNDDGGNRQTIHPQAWKCYDTAGGGTLVNASKYFAYLYHQPGCKGTSDLMTRWSYKDATFSSISFSPTR